MLFKHLFSSFCRNILELVEFFEEEDKFYLVFEKLRGGTLPFPLIVLLRYLFHKAKLASLPSY